MSQEPIPTSESLDEAYEAVEKMLRWTREMLHKLDCVYEDLEEFLVSVDRDPLVCQIKDRVGESRLLGRLVLKGLEE